MKKVKNIKFGVFMQGRIVGELVRAKDFDDLMDNKILKRQKKSWMVVKFRDNEGRTISISEQFINEGMTPQECIEDHIIFGDLDDDITVLNPNGSGTINL